MDPLYGVGATLRSLDDPLNLPQKMGPAIPHPPPSLSNTHQHHTLSLQTVHQMSKMTSVRWVAVLCCLSIQVAAAAHAPGLGIAFSAVPSLPLRATKPTSINSRLILSNLHVVRGRRQCSFIPASSATGTIFRSSLSGSDVEVDEFDSFENLEAATQKQEMEIGQVQAALRHLVAKVCLPPLTLSDTRN